MAIPRRENPARRRRLIPDTGRYSPIQYVASFVGFAPVNDPAVTILVVLDSPVGAHHGGEVGGPVFKRVAEQVLAYLDVPHDVPVVPAVEMAARRREVAKRDAREDAEDPQLAKDRDEAAAPAAPQQAAEAAPVIAGNTAAPTVDIRRRARNHGSEPLRPNRARRHRSVFPVGPGAGPCWQRGCTRTVAGGRRTREARHAHRGPVRPRG